MLKNDRLDRNVKWIESLNSHSSSILIISDNCDAACNK